ncbi:M16 family metallopeptidase [Bacteroides sp. GD17]|uniref:M16 family metallopeptidase n=1 Tax=Bacteroides sp. GD17 TaxID=3139826 RepID=UPI0025E53621|nr:M16 family metallopeptidase [uncultured Bacteroides sp.]
MKVVILALVGYVLSPALAVAQQMPPIPVDKDVKIGKLDNGLTYYIRHNEYPKGQADFYIAQKVGSILETEEQRGLAHFLEHMCFNGTKSFPGNSLTKWLESVGVKFGQNLNAATGWDKTFYRISSVPVAREGVQDSCLLVLHDWANDLLLDGEEIDKERKVIHEEWRIQMPPQMRIMEKTLPVLMPDSRYAHRLPIGLMSVVDNFPHQALRDYYEKWYRPDLQGIMIVGDIDVNRVEAKIKEMFADIEMPANPAKREYFPVPDNKETIYAVGKDKELPNSRVDLLFKFDATPDSLKGNMDYLIMQYLTNMVSMMMEYRLNDIVSKADAPFAATGVMSGELFGIAKTKDALNYVAIAKGTDVKGALEAIYREALRAKRSGFTATEYARCRSEYLSGLEKAYKNRSQQENESLVQAYVEHFLNNEPIPGIENEYQMMNMLANRIPVEAVNQLYNQMVPDDNRLVMCSMPDKEGIAYPTEAELAAVMARVDAEDIAPYVDNVKTEPLIGQLPAAGKVVAEKPNKEFDAMGWMLSNGAKVLVKKTDFKADEICVDIISKGGTSIYGEEDADNLIFMPLMLQQYGLGKFSYADLVKYLAGKQVSLNISLKDYDKEMTGQTTPKDLKTMMELIYMAFTDLNVTAEEFSAMQNTYKGLFQNQSANPQFIFSQKLHQVLYNAPRKQMVSVAAIEKANRERMLEIVHKCFSNAANFTFVFSGNIELDELKALAEQYLATLPADAAKKEDVKRANLGMNGGNKTDEFVQKMEVPQTYAAVIVTGSVPYTVKNKLMTQMAAQIMTARLLNKVREDEGATYSIQTQGKLTRLEDTPLILQTVFPMKPEKKEDVLKIVRSEFEQITQRVDPAELKTVKEFMVKEFTEGLTKNNAWVNNMAAYELLPVNTLTGAIDTLNTITEKDMAEFMKLVMDQNNYRVVVLDPEK